MKFLILGLIAFVLLIPSTAFATLLDESIFGFTIEGPKGWIMDDRRNDGTDNLVKYYDKAGNAFLYVALDKTPDISTILKGESYLREMESYFQNNCNCNNFILKDSDISSSDGKTAYMIYYSYKNSDLSPTITTRQIEIPDNGQIWRITNQYNSNNANGEIQYSKLLSSFRTVPIVEIEKKSDDHVVNHSEKFDNWIDQQLNNPEHVKDGFASALIYSDGPWSVIVTRNYEVQPTLVKNNGIKILPFQCSTKLAIGDPITQSSLIGEYEVRLNPNSPNSGLAVIKDGFLLGKKFGGGLNIHGSCNDSVNDIRTHVGGGCLIATATYGSELAPEVQKLRELRDNSLLGTESGTSFMNIFNDVYYSFSPYIADYEREHPIFKEMVKLAITPMITSLSLMEYAESESEVLGIGISLIMLNVMMYVGIPVIAVMRFRR